MEAIQNSLSYLTCGLTGGPSPRRIHRASTEARPETHETSPGGQCRLSNSTMAWLVGSVSASTLILSLSTLIGRTPFNRPEESKALILRSDSSAVSASAPLRGGVLSSAQIASALDRELRILDTATSTAPKYGVNLVQDWSGEDAPFTVYGWELGSGSWSQNAVGYGVSIDSKDYFFYTGSQNAELFQTIDLSDYAADIATGTADFFASGTILEYYISSKVAFEFFTSDGQISLGTFSKSGSTAFEIMDKIPIGSGQVKVKLTTLNSGYSSYYARFDSITFFVKQNPILPDAYVGEPYSVALPTQSFPYIMFNYLPTRLTRLSGSSIPDHIQFEKSRHRIEWRPTASEIGTHSFKAIEGSNYFADQTRVAPFTITVQPSRRQSCSAPDLGLTYGNNLVSNPSAELTPITAYGWVINSGSWTTSTTTGIADGSRSFYTTSEIARISQLIDVCSHRVPIDRGDQYFLFSAMTAILHTTPRFEIYFLDSLGRLLSFSRRSVPGNIFQYIDPLPRDTASVEINLMNKDNNGYSSYYTSFDKVSFSLLKPFDRERATAGASFSKVIPPEVYGNDLSLVLSMQWADGQKLPVGATFDAVSRTFSWSSISPDFVGLNMFNLHITNAVGDNFHDVPFPVLVRSVPGKSKLSKTYIPHDAASGFEIGTFQSVGETHHNPITYTLVSDTGGDDNALFNIVDNRLFLSSPLPGTEQSLSIRVRGTDCVGNTGETVYTFLTEAPEKRAAKSISLSYDRVSEQADPGTVIGTLSTDLSSGLITQFELESGPGDYDNAAFAVLGTELKTVSDLTYRATPYRIRVAAVSVDGVRTAQALDITVQPCSFHS